ncbi:Hypothetical predicted protein [Paramuricea clavata]|uniref:Uncharacterized protein n=1 Tax=Paramuricea clavata TaxID=317549 RepID=A0A6S7KWG6_PARCT|nr:Hypothetical predicted protein [Paramuricea clavata]
MEDGKMEDGGCDGVGEGHAYVFTSDDLVPEVDHFINDDQFETQDDDNLTILIGECEKLLDEDSVISNKISLTGTRG